MIKHLSIFGCVFALTSTIWLTGIYDHSVPTIEGGTQSLSDYEGKKILIITLPIVRTTSSDSLLYSLDTLAIERTASLKVIAVPSYEDGYLPAQKDSLKTWYRSKLGSYVTITDGLYTRKTSGIQQHVLFKWLTTVEENTHFDMDVAGSGFKFFLSSTGQLYGLLPSHTKIWSSAVQKTLGME